jgi:small subunit ribosomal protein S21
MSVGEKLRAGDTIEKALRRFKKKVDTNGVLKTLRNTRYYLKPSDKKREKSKAAAKRAKLAAKRGY